MAMNWAPITIYSGVNIYPYLGVTIVGLVDRRRRRCHHGDTWAAAWKDEVDAGMMGELGSSETALDKRPKKPERLGPCCPDRPRLVAGR